MRRLQTPTTQNCILSLVLFARLTHAWQGYYAHGIQRNGSVGRIEGSPEEIPEHIIPSSWESFKNPGEHGRTEPASRAPDYVERFNAAKDFTRRKFNAFIPMWWEACKCHFTR
jgi:hypothetical protein